MKSKKEITISNATRDRVEACRSYIESIVHRKSKGSTQNRSKRSATTKRVGISSKSRWKCSISIPKSKNSLKRMY